jgi:hypothetical protein
LLNLYNKEMFTFASPACELWGLLPSDVQWSRSSQSLGARASAQQEKYDYCMAQAKSTEEKITFRNWKIQNKAILVLLDDVQLEFNLGVQLIN